MSRDLHVSPAPELPPPRGTLVTPTPQAAPDFAAPRRCLEQLAQAIVQRQQWAIATPLEQSRQLRQSVQACWHARDPAGTARAVQPALTALLRANLDLARLQAEAAPRLVQLAQLVQHYRQALHARQRLDPAALFWQAAAGVEPRDRQPYCVYGYFHPRRDQLALIDAIADTGSQFVLPLAAESPLFAGNRAAVVWLQARGWQVQETAAPAANVGDAIALGRQLQHQFLNQGDRPLPRAAGLDARVRASASADLEAEVRNVLAQVKTQLAAGVAARDIVLVARDERRYGPLLLEIAAEYAIPLHVGYEIPLRETRLGAWLGLLLDAMQANFPFEQTARALAHPLACQLTAEPWALARQQRPSGWTAWQALGLDLSAYVWHDEPAPPAVWWQRWQTLAAAGNLDQHADIWPRARLALDCFQHALADRAAAASAPWTRAEFVQELRALLEGLSVPMQPAGGGVALHNPLALFGARYACVFALGAAEGWLPAALADDPWLDFHARRQLAAAGFSIDTAAEAARREALSFYFLLAVPTARLHLSYPERQERETLLPSPYLTQLGLTVQSPPAVPLASWPELRRSHLRVEAAPLDAVGERARRVWQIELRRESAAPADEYDGIVGLPLDPARWRFSATQLTALGQCPFKWLARYVWQLQAPAEATAELAANQRGQLYHRCLELALCDGQTAAEVAQLSPAQLQQAFQQVEQDLALPAWPDWARQRDEHLELLQLNLSAVDFLAPGAAIAARETPFQLSDWYGLRVSGTVDRVDRGPDGLRVLDYKTSSQAPAGVQDTSGKAGLDIQLAIYQAAIAAKFPREVVEKAAYYSLTKRRLLKVNPPTDTELATFAQRVSQHLATGYYPVAPDRQRQACRHCPYDLVCRRGPRLKRKEILPHARLKESP